MNTKQSAVDFPEVQDALYGMALSLDAFLLNGIPNGLLQRALFNGFLEKTAGNLLADLASLEERACEAPVANQPKVTEILGALRAKCQELIDLVMGLGSFRTLPLQHLRSTISQIPLLRAEFVQLIQQLEAGFRTPKPFYLSRPAHSTVAVNDFLAHLPQLFEEAWHMSRNP
jgi:hypothetical protein